MMHGPINIRFTEEYVFFAGVLQLSFQLGGLKSVTRSVIYFFNLFSLSIIHVVESQDINLIPSLNKEMNVTRSRRLSWKDNKLNED